MGLVRLYHLDEYSPTATRPRLVGPIGRFDPHVVSGDEPALCEEGRSVVYVANDFITGFFEIFGDLTIAHSRSSRPVEARICPQWRVAAVQPVTPVRVTNLKGRGCSKINASPALGTGDVSRELSQEWARAMNDHHPQSGGVKYRSAHDYGDCMAIWDGAPELAIDTLPNGATQDYPLHDRGLWRRLIVAGKDVGLPVIKQDRTTCRDCREHSDLIWDIPGVSGRSCSTGRRRAEQPER